MLRLRQCTTLQPRAGDWAGRATASTKEFEGEDRKQEVSEETLLARAAPIHTSTRTQRTGRDSWCWGKDDVRKEKERRRHSTWSTKRVRRALKRSEVH